LIAFILLGILVAVLLLWYGAIPRRAALSSAIHPTGANPGQYFETDSFRLATYNIHGGKGTDRIKDLDRTAGVIRGADIAALQEVHGGWRFNQAQRLGGRLGLGWMFAPTIRYWYKDGMGNGLLSGFPVKKLQTYRLPSVQGRRYRVYTVAEIQIRDSVLSLLFTHLHTRSGRERQLEIVLRQFRSLPLPAVLIGDLNSNQGDPVLLKYLPGDATDAIARTSVINDVARVDWILTRGLEIKGGGQTPLGVSDHPCYWVDVGIAPGIQSGG